MNTITKIFVITVIFLIEFTSCRKDIALNPNDADYNTDVEQFEVVWNGLNTAYVLWPADKTDWDNVYKKYRPIFENMDNEPDSIWDKAWKGLTATLVDHHMHILLHRPSNNHIVSLSPGHEEVKSRDYYHSGMFSWSYQQMLKRIEASGRLTNTFNVLLDVNFEHCYSGVLDNDIAYIYISSFNNNLDTIRAFRHFKQLVADNNIKSAIIDIRDNGGGILSNINNVVSCFTTELLLVGSNQTKVGLGRYEHSPKVSFYANFDDNIVTQDRNIPIIALVNVNSASMSEITAIAIRNLPQGYVIGERTYGAICASPQTDDFSYFYSGTFGQIGQGHYVKTAKYLFSDADGNYLEGNGIEPDVTCLFDKSLWDNGVDNQLECAISFLKEKTK